jgi:RNA polymerase sigma factor (sigma-70 family)
VASLVQRVIRFRTFYVPEEERADLVQEVMLQVWRAVAVREGVAPRNFDGFVRSIAYRRCVDWVRQRVQKVVDLPPAPPGDSPDEALQRREENRLGREILRELRPACRELIRLHAGLQLPYREIAASQGRTEAAVRTQMCACLAEARRMLERLLRGRGGKEEDRR